MSRTHDDQNLRKLCSGATLTRARTLLYQARLRTGPGTGYDLGGNVQALPGICAYIASQELGNTDVSEKTAQMNACISLPAFRSALNSVRSAIAASTSRTRQKNPVLTYAVMIRRKSNSELLELLMREVEKFLLNEESLPDRYRSASAALIASVYLWTCKILEVSDTLLPDQLADTYGFSITDYNEITDVLNVACQNIAQDIRRRWTDPDAVKERIPTTNVLQETNSSPSRIATRSLTRLARAKGEPVPTPHGTPNFKRKVSFSESLAEDEDEIPFETPTKRQKFSSPSTSYRTPKASRTFTSSRLSPVKKGVCPTPSTSTSTSQSSAAPRSIDITEQTDDDASVEHQILETQITSTTIPPSDIAGPSTPRRPRMTAQPRSGSAVYRSGSKTPARMTPARISRFVDDQPRTRFRPVFLDQKQWLQRDPRLELQNKRAEELCRGMVEKLRGLRV